MVQSIKETGGIHILQIIPHGLFEISAFLIVMPVGVQLGWFAVLSRSQLWAKIKGSGLVLVMFVLPMLVIASVIEATALTLF
ncbi:MAG: putative membrane protein SpoIIM required for sporulation [Candidatus Woesearchaeota archaeon]|jgi:uncharacterized membrane protein SpoIIM required for sporulation